MWKNGENAFFPHKPCLTLKVCAVGVEGTSRRGARRSEGGEEIMGCEREAAEGEKEGEAMDGNLKEVKTAEGRGNPGAHVQEATPPPSPPSRSDSRIVMRGRISSSFLHRALCVHRGGGGGKREK